MERDVCADNRAKGEYPGPPQLAARLKKPSFWSVTTVITCNDASLGVMTIGNDGFSFASPGHGEQIPSAE